MSTKLNAILIIGPPGVGKGTQGKVLGCIPGFVHHSSGDVFRSLNKASDLGRTFLSYSSRGELVPDALTIDIWRADIDRRVHEGSVRADKDVLILDGIPRNPAQAKIMDEHVHVLGIANLVVSDDDELVRRLRARAEKENRPDDADEGVIRRRLEIYEDATRPLLAHYDSGLIREVDGLGRPIEVAGRAIEAVVKIVG